MKALTTKKSIPLRTALVTLIFLLITAVLSGNTEKPQLARMHYDGGGDWYNDPDTLPNYVDYLSETFNINLSSEQAVVKPSDSSIFDYPFVYMTGHGNIHLSERDVRNLREYLLRGGFLYADDDYGMDEAFRREIRKVFPDREMVELPANHSLFNCYFNFPNGIPKIHEHDGKRPQAFGIFDDNGRLMVLYTYETNVSDGWTDAHDNPPDIQEQAFQMGVNMMYYLMTE